MKIILSSYTDLGNPRTPKGLELEYLAKEFEKRNELVSVICRGYKNPEKLKVSFKYVRVPIPFGNKIPIFLTLINRKILKGFALRLISQMLYDFFSSRELNIKADILCCTLPSLVKNIRKAKEKGMKVIVFATSGHIKYINELLNEEYKKFGLNYKPIFEKYNVESYSNADYIIARSEFCARTLVESGIHKEKVFPKYLFSPVNYAKFKPGTKKQKEDIFRVIFVGAVNINKGVIYLLEAWKRLNLKDAELLICGFIAPEMEKVVKEHSSDKSIKFLGYVNPLPYLQKSKVFCLPSLSEGCPQAAAEAMACELPVIMSENSGSMAEDGKEGFIVPIRNAKSIAKKILYFYNNPSKARKMGELARKKVSNFSIEKYSKMVCDYIEEAYKQLKKEG